MAYYNSAETQKRLEAVRKILVEKKLDAALVYFDELNVANGWYLTGWCPQFEKEAVMVFANDADSILLGGPESAPFAKYASCASAILPVELYARIRRVLTGTYSAEPA